MYLSSHISFRIRLGKAEFFTSFKRYSKIDQHLAWHFKYNGACVSSPPPFLCSQIITPFSYSMISTNKEIGL